MIKEDPQPPRTENERRLHSFHYRRMALANLPSIDRLLQTEQVQEWLRSYPRPLVVEALRAGVDAERRRILAGEEGPSLDRILREALSALEVRCRRSLRRCINATGVVIHTNLGRSLLPQSAIDAVVEVSQSHSTLEIDVETGERSSRHIHIEGLLKELTGAEASAVFNNNAAAVLLSITALAKGKEVIVSAGQLVEIGGSFRIPEVIESGGARLRIVGTTNRTRLSDYQKAIDEETGLLLLVHPSNYRLIGFTQSVPAEELVALGREYGIPVMEDLGSGLLVDLSAYGLSDEPVVNASLKAGVDIVTFSGDKLLGGPQAGIVLGRKDLVEQIKKHPMARAVRCDKMTLAALEATLRLYRDGVALEAIPTLAALLKPPSEIEQLARTVAEKIPPGYLSVELVEGYSQVGGGALPGENLPTFLLALKHQRISAGALAYRLRLNNPPIFARIQQDQVLLDFRTIKKEEIPEVQSALVALAQYSGEE